MKISICNATLVAFGIAGGICLSASTGEAAVSRSIATHPLPVVGNFRGYYFTAQSREPVRSALCRLPIRLQAADWKIDRRVRCG